jgi:hypothetical protein
VSENRARQQAEAMLGEHGDRQDAYLRIRLGGVLRARLPLERSNVGREEDMRVWEIRVGGMVIRVIEINCCFRKCL